MIAVARIRDGEDVAAVMTAWGYVAPRRTNGWARLLVRGRGLHCLASRKGTGRKPKLTRTQKSQVFRWVNGKNPLQYGFDFALWTREAVRELILRKFDIRLSVTSVGSLLAELGTIMCRPSMPTIVG